jgi:hypothetical protein
LKKKVVRLIFYGVPLPGLIGIASTRTTGDWQADARAPTRTTGDWQADVRAPTRTTGEWQPATRAPTWTTGHGPLATAWQAVTRAR